MSLNLPQKIPEEFHRGTFSSLLQARTPLTGVLAFTWLHVGGSKLFSRKLL